MLQVMPGACQHSIPMMLAAVPVRLVIAVLGGKSSFDFVLVLSLDVFDENVVVD